MLQNMLESTLRIHFGVLLSYGYHHRMARCVYYLLTKYWSEGAYAARVQCFNRPVAG